MVLKTCLVMDMILCPSGLCPVTRKLEIKCLGNRNSEFQQLDINQLFAKYARKTLHLLYIFSFPPLGKNPDPFQN